jgi:hypothetical protein
MTERDQTFCYFVDPERFGPVVLTDDEDPHTDKISDGWVMIGAIGPSSAWSVASTLVGDTSGGGVHTIGRSCFMFWPSARRLHE